MGTITTLETAIGVSPSETLTHRGECLFAATVYTGSGIYDMVYTVIDTTGNAQSYAEEEGILPAFFHSPAGETYVSVSPYHPHKEQEVCIPVVNRTGMELPQPNRPFVGDYIGVSDPYTILYEVDSWSDTKPDKLLEFFYSKGTQGYHNLLTGEIWEMNEKDLVISGLVKTADHAYAVVCYPRTPDDVTNKQIIVLNRQLSP